MAFKERTKPFRLQVMESLANRMRLSREERRKFSNWVKGYNGELKWDTLTALLKCDCLVLNDLYLAVKGKSFQVDALVITAEGIGLYEVKNFEGEYYYENGKMYHGRTKKEVFDPIYQIRNAESLMRQLVDQMGFNLAVNKYIVFVNPNFTLFQAPRDSGVIMPGMLTSHFSKVNDIPGRLSQSHHRFAAEIKRLHIADFTLNGVPYYEESMLKKGVTCFNCGAFINQFSKKRSCVCKYCGEKEVVSQTIIRHALERKRLFPNQNITTPTTRSWCDSQFSESRVRYVLTQHFTAKGTGRWTYYE